MNDKKLLITVIKRVMRHNLLVNNLFMYACLIYPCMDKYVSSKITRNHFYNILCLQG